MYKTFVQERSAPLGNNLLTLILTSILTSTLSLSLSPSLNLRHYYYSYSHAITPTPTPSILLLLLDSSHNSDLLLIDPHQLIVDCTIVHTDDDINCRLFTPTTKTSWTNWTIPPEMR